MSDLLSSLFRALSPLWEMSLTAAYAAAVVALLRLFLKKRAPRQVLCLLWLVVFARLLAPLSLESPLSIVPDAQQSPFTQNLTVEPAGGAQNVPSQDHHEPIQNPAPGQPGGVTADAVSQGNANPAPVLTAPEGTAPAAPQPEEKAPASFPWQAALAGVWLAGALAMGGYGLVSYLRLKRRLFDAIRARDGAWEHPSVSSPFILGVLRPRIYLPAGLRGQPRQFILCHERAHLRRLDHIVKPVCWAALALHWFNPFVWLAFVLMSRDIEAACDEAVIRQLGQQVKADYSTTLLSLATNGRVPAPCPLAFDEGDAKGRIKNVLNYRRPALWIVVISVAAAVLAAVCLLTDPVSAGAPEGDPDPEVSESQTPPPSQPPVEEDSVADPWMIEVLNGERTFQLVYGGAVDAAGGSFDITQLTMAYYGSQPGGTTPEAALSKVSVIDLDGDGAEEMVVWPSINGDDSIEEVSVPGYLILRLRGDSVLAYNPSFRGFAYVKEDGTFYWSNSAFEGGIASARFPEDVKFDWQNVSWCDIGPVEENYFVDGVRADRDAYEAAIYAQDHKPDAPWYVYEGGQLWPAAPEAPFRPDTLLSAPGPRDLTQEELEYFQNYFALGSDGRVPNIRSMLLVSEYSDPRDIDLFRTFYHGFHYVPDVTQAERDALDWHGHSEEIKVTAAEMDQTLRAYLGLTLEETRKVGLDLFHYLPEYNAYYTAHNDFGGDWFTMRAGRIRADGTIALVYDSSEFHTTRVALLEEAEQIYAHRLYYRVKANLPADAQYPYAALPQPVSTPEPEPSDSPAPSAAPAVCEHGLESIALDVMDGQLIARCTRDGHIYPVPGVRAAEWQGQTGTADGSGWLREDMDGDGELEVFVFVTDSDFIVDSRIVSLDAENGKQVSYVFRFQTLIDDFSQNCAADFDFENRIMTVSYGGRSKQAEIDEGYWSYMQNHGGGFDPVIWPTDMWITSFLLCGFPVHNGRGLNLGITAMWNFDYSASGGLRPMFASNW